MNEPIENDMSRYRQILLLSLLLLISALQIGWAQAPASKYRPAPVPPLPYSVQLGQSLEMDVIADLNTDEKGLSLHSVDRPQMGAAVIKNNRLYYIPGWGAEGLDSFWVQIERQGGYTFAVQLDLTVLPPPEPGLPLLVQVQVPFDIPLQLQLHAGNETVATAAVVGPTALAQLELPAAVADSTLVWASATGTNSHGQGVELRALAHSAGAIRAGALHPPHLDLNALSTAAFALMQRAGFTVEHSTVQALPHANALDPEQVLRSAAVLEVFHRDGCCLPPGIESAYAALLDPATHAWLESLTSDFHLESTQEILLVHSARPLEFNAESRLPLRRAASTDSVRTDGLFGLEFARQGPWGPEQLQLPWRRSQRGVTASNSGSYGHRNYSLDQPVDYTDRMPLQCPQPHPGIDTNFRMVGLRGWQLARVLDVQLAQVTLDAWPLDFSVPLPPGCGFDLGQMQAQQRQFLLGQPLPLESTGFGGGSIPAFLHIELPLPGADARRLQAARIELQGGSGCSLAAEGFDPQCHLQHQWNAQGEWQGMQLWAIQSGDEWQSWEFRIERLRAIGEPHEMPFNPDPVVGEWQVQSRANWGESGVHTSLGVQGWWLSPAGLSPGWLESSDGSARVGLRSAPAWRSFLFATSDPQGGVIHEIEVPGEQVQPAPWRDRPVYSDWQGETLRMESHYDSATEVWHAQCPQPIEPSCQLQHLREWTLLGNPFAPTDGSPDPQARLLVRERVSSRDTEGEWQTGDWRLKIYRGHGYGLPVN
jgi:hypothetical protein